MYRQPNRLTASEYFMYSHWDAGKFDKEAKKTFLSQNAKKQIDAPWINTWPELLKTN